MYPRSRLTWSAFAVLCAGVLAAPLSIQRVEARQGVTRTIYVSAVTNDDVLVKDMTAADFEVKEGGKVQTITVKPATTPLRVTIVDADGATGAFQAGIANFIQKLINVAEFKVVSVIVQPQLVTDFTSDVAKLQQAIRDIGPRGSRQPAQLMEALYAEAKVEPVPGKRSVIVATRVGREAPSTERPENIRNLLKDHGTPLYVVSINGADRGNFQMGNSAPGQEAEQARSIDFAESANALQLVVSDGARESGGRRLEVVTKSMVPSMVAIADELLAQYEITYTLPAGQKPNEKLEVKSKRKDIKINAPTKLTTNVGQ